MTQADTNDPAKMLDYKSQRGKDLLLARRAVSQGWPVPTEIFELIVRQTSAILGQAIKANDPRGFYQAARFFMDMDASNLERARIILAAERLNLDRSMVDSVSQHGTQTEGQKLRAFLNDLRDTTSERVGEDASAGGNGRPDPGGNGSHR